MTTGTIDLDTPYALTEDQIEQFRRDGFIKLKDVFTPELIEAYAPEITRLTMEAAQEKAGVPMDERDTYSKAFLQVWNLWEKSDKARAFSCSKRLARIATELLGTRGVRMWHDQALYKEPAGGFTPWHADQQYWPMSNSNSVTAWVPLQATPIEMGPLCFGRGSHLKNIGRDLEISDESERQIREQIQREGILEIQEPYDLGEVSFHYGWTLHRAGPNTTDQPRKVHTIIYMDRDMRLVEPKNDNQRADWEAWTPSTQIGRIMADEKNPILFDFDQ